MKGLSIKISAKNMDLTEPIKQYVYDKLDGMQKFFPQVQLFEVELRQDDKHRKGYFVAEVNTTVPGTLLRAEKTHEDLYAAIDAVKDQVERQLQKQKGRRQAARRKDQKSRRAAKAIMFWRRFDRFGGGSEADEL